MKTKILADFQICISVPLIFIFSSNVSTSSQGTNFTKETYKRIVKENILRDDILYPYNSLKEYKSEKGIICLKIYI